MKFAEHLSAHITPEWRKQYINYKKLKDILYDAVRQGVLGEENAAYHEAVEEKFFAMINKELLKINQFHQARESDAVVKFEELSSEVNLIMRERDCSQAANSPPSGVRIRLTGRTPSQRKARAYAQKMENLRTAFSEFYLNLVLVQNFQGLNQVGFRKILKKHDKMLETRRGKGFYEQTVLTAHFTTSKTINQLIESTETVMIEKLEGGNRHRAMNRLRVPPLGNNWSPLVTFRLGLWLGMVAICLLALVLSGFYVNFSQVDRLPEAVHLFRGPLITLLMIFAVGVNTYGWRVSGVNHVLIFEVDPRNNLSGFQIMEAASFLGITWFLSALLYALLGALNFTVKERLGFPLIVLGVCFVCLFLPLKTFHWRSRYWLLRRLGRIVCAPFYSVEFADFWLADQLNSLAVVFLDLEYTVCFYTHDWDRDVVGETRTCGSVTYGLRPIIASLPAWFRFAQCLRRYRDTREANPHLLNAGKYSTTFFVVLFSSLSAAEKERHHGKQQYGVYFGLWVASALISTAYTYSWDIFMDWGLMCRDVPHSRRYLRQELVYSRKCFYYAAMLLDFVFRLFWTLTVSVGEGGHFHSAVLSSLLAAAEVFRRFVWNFLRLENEHLNNCGKFRAVRDISILPLRPAVTSADDVVENCDDEDDADMEGEGTTDMQSLVMSSVRIAASRTNIPADIELTSVHSNSAVARWAVRSTSNTPQNADIIVLQ